MTTSIELDPVLDKLVELEAKRQGISKSEFVSKALDQVISPKSPLEIYRQVFNPSPEELQGPTTYLSENTGQRVKELLREKYSS
jgi:hypothetical protein